MLFDPLQEETVGHLKGKRCLLEASISFTGPNQVAKCCGLMSFFMAARQFFQISAFFITGHFMELFTDLFTGVDSFLGARKGVTLPELYRLYKRINGYF